MAEQPFDAQRWLERSQRLLEQCRATSPAKYMRRDLLAQLGAAGAALVPSERLPTDHWGHAATDDAGRAAASAESRADRRAAPAAPSTNDDEQPSARVAGHDDVECPGGSAIPAAPAARAAPRSFREAFGGADLRARPPLEPPSPWVLVDSQGQQPSLPSAAGGALDESMSFEERRAGGAEAPESFVEGFALSLSLDDRSKQGGCAAVCGC
jgi:hypothetical protein